jgi:hypothetical protein
VAAPIDSQAFLRTGGLSGVFVGDSPMTRLASEVYAALEPYAELDATYNYALRTLVEAVTKTFTDVDELVRTSVAGDPAWSAAFDATRVPTEGLAWLGQLVGTPLLRGDPIATSRLRVAGAEGGIRRGSLTTMIAVAKRLLTGNKTVVVSERTTDAWHFSIRTRTTETPSSAAVLAALQAQKPAGLIMDYATFTGILFGESLLNQATYTLSTAAKSTYTLRGT